MEREDDIVRLATANNPAQAHLWQQALEAEGIRCQTVGDYLEVVFGDMPGIRPELWVQRGDVERAQAILAEHQQPLGETTREEEE